MNTIRQVVHEYELLFIWHCARNVINPNFQPHVQHCQEQWHEEEHRQGSELCATLRCGVTSTVTSTMTFAGQPPGRNINHTDRNRMLIHFCYEDHPVLDPCNVLQLFFNFLLKRYVMIKETRINFRSHDVMEQTFYHVAVKNPNANSINVQSVRQNTPNVYLKKKIFQLCRPRICQELSLQLATYFQLNGAYVPNSFHAYLLSRHFSYMLLPFSSLLFL